MTMVVVHGLTGGVRVSSCIVVVTRVGGAGSVPVITSADAPRPRRLGGDQQEDQQDDEADTHGPRLYTSRLGCPPGPVRAACGAGAGAGAAAQASLDQGALQTCRHRSCDAVAVGAVTRLASRHQERLGFSRCRVPALAFRHIEM